MEEHRAEDVPWLQLGADACRHAGITFDSMKIVTTWDRDLSANAVYEIGERLYLKLFGPDVPHQFQVERTLLDMLADHLDIPSPDIIAMVKAAYRLAWRVGA